MTWDKDAGLLLLICPILFKLKIFQADVICSTESTVIRQPSWYHPNKKSNQLSMLISERELSGEDSCLVYNCPYVPLANEH